MKPKQIIEEIGSAGSWLPLTTVQAVFAHHRALTPVFLEAVRERAATPNPNDIRLQRLATFGLFYLAQHRNQDLFEPLVRLMEMSDEQAQDEWLFSSRLFFFGHRLLAGISPTNPERVIEIVMNPNLRAMTRATALPAIGLLAAFGDIARNEAVRHLRTLFPTIKAARIPDLEANWVRTAAKVHCVELQNELQWFLSSGRMDRDFGSLIANVLRHHPDDIFLSILQLEPAVDIVRNVFQIEVRDGEIGLLPNAMIPRLHEFLEQGPEISVN